MRALHQADTATVIGFSMSEFDAMAQMQFAEVARARSGAQQQLRVIVIDPYLSDIAKDRFRRVFRQVEFVSSLHETIEWDRY